MAIGQPILSQFYQQISNWSLIRLPYLGCSLASTCRWPMVSLLCWSPVRRWDDSTSSWSRSTLGKPSNTNSAVFVMASLTRAWWKGLAGGKGRHLRVHHVIYIITHIWQKIIQKYSSSISIVPDTFPVEECFGEECMAGIVWSVIRWLGSSDFVSKDNNHGNHAVTGVVLFCLEK